MSARSCGCSRAPGATAARSSPGIRCRGRSCGRIRRTWPPTAGDIVFYGTMEGWLKAVDQKTGKLLWEYKTPSGIIGNPMTYVGPDGKQYVAVLSGIGGWAGIGVAAGIGADEPTEGQGALGAFGDAGSFTTQGGVLTVFSL